MNIPQLDWFPSRCIVKLTAYRFSLAVHQLELLALLFSSQERRQADERARQRVASSLQRAQSGWRVCGSAVIYRQFADVATCSGVARALVRVAVCLLSAFAVAFTVL